MLFCGACGKRCGHADFSGARQLNRQGQTQQQQGNSMLVVRAFNSGPNRKTEHCGYSLTSSSVSVTVHSEPWPLPQLLSIGPDPVSFVSNF
jgi:hypothetical protein